MIRPSRFKRLTILVLALHLIAFFIWLLTTLSSSYWSSEYHPESENPNFSSSSFVKKPIEPLFSTPFNGTDVIEKSLRDDTKSATKFLIDESIRNVFSENILSQFPECLFEFVETSSSDHFNFPLDSHGLITNKRKLKISADNNITLFHHKILWYGAVKAVDTSQDWSTVDIVVGKGGSLSRSMYENNEPSLIELPSEDEFHVLEALSKVCRFVTMKRRVIKKMLNIMKDETKRNITLHHNDKYFSSSDSNINNNNNSIPPVYLIHYTRVPQRLGLSKRLFEEKLNLKTFSVVNGFDKEDIIEDYSDINFANMSENSKILYGEMRSTLERQLYPGEFSLFLKTLAIYFDMLSKNLNKVMVFEDDVSLSSHFSLKRLNTALELGKDANANILVCGSCLHSKDANEYKNKTIRLRFRQVTRCALSYAIDKEGVFMMIKSLPIRWPIDNQMDFMDHPSFKIMLVEPPLLKPNPSPLFKWFSNTHIRG